MSITTPRLIIAGQPIADAWEWTTSGQLIGIADITIPWGREQITEPVPGHAAQVRLLDTDPTMARYEYAALVGLAAEIRRTGGIIDQALLVGQITDMATRLVKLKDHTGIERALLEITLTISDTQATLNRRYRRGPGNGVQLYATGGAPTRRVAGAWGFGGWDAQLTAARVAALGPEIARWTPDIRPPRTTFPKPTGHRDYIASRAATQPVQEGVPVSELVSVGELLQRAYTGSEGMGWCRIVPGERAEQGRPQQAGAVILRTGTNASAQMRIVPQNRAVPASVLGIPGAASFPSMSIEDRVSTVTISLSRHDYDWQEKLISNGQVIRDEQLIDDDTSTVIVHAINKGGEAVTDISPNAGMGASTMRPQLDGNPPATRRGSEESKAATNAAVALAIEYAERAEHLNDWLKLPPLTYSPNRDEHEQEQLMQTWDTDAVHITGSKWHALTRVPRTVQFIGGTLTWNRTGWSHELHAAPTIDTLPRNLTLGELLAVDNAINRFAANVTIADLAAVTERTT